jgi:sterol desaturase/sphingolipid hydroxylase (fatty acid hydroxylase superfamily)
MTVSIAAEHLHIIEYFFVSLLSTSVPVSMLGRRMHVITYVLYVIFRIMESINAHCGYDFSWSPYSLLPGCQPSSWHNFHHSHQKGNFSGGFWDYICGTHKPYLEYMAKIKSKESSEKKDK